MSDDQYESILKRLDNIEKRLNMDIERPAPVKSKDNRIIAKIILYIFVFIVLFNVVLLILWKFKPDNDTQTNQIASLISSVFFTAVIAYSIHERNKEKEDHD